MSWKPGSLVLAVLGVLGCHQETLDDALCPPGGTELTYENFGGPLFDAYCNECHGGNLAYSSRAFGSVTRIREHRERIYVTATPDNASMPPGPGGPGASERAKLAEWLACGAP